MFVITTDLHIFDSTITFLIDAREQLGVCIM